MSEERRAELQRRLAAVRGRIEAACAAAGRDAREVALLAVTKTVPAADVAILLDLGLAAFGENRAQEAAAKVGEVARLRPLADPAWHFVGVLQRNKVRMVLPWVTRVESVDSARLVDTLATAIRRARDEGVRKDPVRVLLQYSVDGDPARGGVRLEGPDGLLALAEHVAGRAELQLDGLMSVAPLDADPDVAFADIAKAAVRLRAEHPGATELSAGMSGDLDVAIRYGSTGVRVGTALVGERRIASQ
ncbi:YggS family pyridoxal phosphate-dependent enzyme [Pseudonocardia asaccharolytica]|uniref:Pyridoxal phosphate homeostasis protein n=1 Tax=Pseudonocardia asaccharolytica DSM 44247 = NBRC 16224 TaxID=1123024 RepID=A0A511D969_9PSEU|nr:YggS family pyridoxal phosphate-dependent enzyme [Pseudonocardia asaccharolytica]GEL20943.1 YggS family pyridoxal phosphate enzyme [Pseudonocardia asaccharolytica DSM 44247 = NBRC 16224]